jgi:hypothetical protein
MCGELLETIKKNGVTPSNCRDTDDKNVLMLDGIIQMICTRETIDKLQQTIAVTHQNMPLV